MGLFVTTLTPDDEYCLRNRENLRQSIQIQLSKKQKNLRQSFAILLKSASNFEHFEKKMT